MNNSVRLLAAALLVAWFIPMTATAQERQEISVDPPAEEVEEELEEELEGEGQEAEASAKDWAVSGLVRYGIGQGTFVDPANDTEFADEVADGSNAYDLSLLTFVLGGSYTFFDEITAELQLAAVQFLTAAGGINEPNEFRFQDIALGASWSGYQFGDTGLMAVASAGLSFPTSELSQATSMIVSTSLTGGLAWALFDGNLTLSYSLTGAKDFHEFTSPTVDIAEVGAENVLVRAGGSENLGDGLVTDGGVNTEYALVNSLAVSMGLWADLRLSVGYSLETYWTYDIEFDPEFNAPGVDVDDGRGVSQLTRTSISLVYPLKPVSEALSLSAFSLGLGTATAYAPKTADNNSFQFPFWNLDGAADNASQVRLWVSAAY